MPHELPTPPRTNPFPWLIFLSLIILAGWGWWLAMAQDFSARDSPRTSAVVSSVPPMSSPVVVVMPTLVYFQELATVAPEPTLTPTSNPVIAAWTPTPFPLMCPTDPSTLPEGAVCTWADVIVTSTPFPPCLTPRPGEMCEVMPTSASNTATRWWNDP
jgi:hypothetical protein